MKRRLIAILFPVLLISGCNTIHPPTNKAPTREFSFSSMIRPGPAHGPARFPLVLVISSAEAPSWYQNPSIYYRLAYSDGRVLQPYSRSRWVAPAAELLTQRLHAYLASQDLFKAVLGPEDGAREDYALRVTLEDFSQVFETPVSSIGQVRVRLTLVDLATQRVVAQRVFQDAMPAPSPDAKGGVIALDQASARLVEAVDDWLAQLAPGLVRQRMASH